ILLDKFKLEATPARRWRSWLVATAAEDRLKTSGDTLSVHARTICDACDYMTVRGEKRELLDGEIFYSLREARIVIESWRRHYNTIRPHASLGYKPPAPEVFVPAFAAWPAALSQAAPPATLAKRPTIHKHPTGPTRGGQIKFPKPNKTIPAETPIIPVRLITRPMVIFLSSMPSSLPSPTRQQGDMLLSL